MKINKITTPEYQITLTREEIIFLRDIIGQTVPMEVYKSLQACNWQKGKSVGDINTFMNSVYNNLCKATE